jgi:hypothetical protein
MKTIVRSVLTLSLLVTPFFGCSKKEGDQPAQQKAASASLLDEQLLQRLPNTTAGFVVMDFNGEGYKKFISSPWASDMQGLNAIKSAVDDLEAQGASEEQIKMAKMLLGSLQKLGLVSADGKSQVEKVLSSSVAFVSIRKEEEVPLDLGVFVRAANGVSIADRVATLKQIVSDAGFKATDETIGGAQGFVTEPNQSGEEPLNVKLYVAGTSDKLGFAFSKGALEGLFASTNTSGLANIRALPEFSKAEEAVRSPESPLSFGFVSFKLLEPILDQTQEEGADDFSLKNNPLAALAFGQGYSTQMVSTAGLVVSPTNDVQKSVFTAFEGSGLPATAFKLPADTAVSLSLDARILGKLETVLKGLDDPSASMVIQQIKNIDGITLGVRNGDGSSPVPDIYLTLDSSTREQVASSLEMGIGLGMMATGQQPQWMSKEISGNPTRYFLTPIGLGVYMSSPKNSKSLIVASSERAVKDLSASESNGASLDTVMSRSLRDRVPSSTSFGSLYLNFIQLGNLLDSVKGTVSSMMGPNPELDQALDSTRLKKLGVGIGNLSYANGVFKVQSVVERIEGR